MISTDAAPDTATPTEARIGEMLREHLAGQRLSPTSDFFAAGGTSLAAIQIATRLQEEFDKELPFDIVFEHSVLRDLAEAVDAAPARGEAGIPRVEDGLEVGAAPGQVQLLFHAELAEDPTAYNVCWAYRGTGPLDVPALEAALQALVRRHESLRTVFDERDGMPVLNVLEDYPDHFSVLEARDASDLDRLLLEGRSRTFDLKRGPLHHSTLIRLSDEEFVLLFVAHHVITDVWSENLIRRDLGAAYEAELSGQAAAWPAIQVRYRDFAHWHASALASGELDAQRAFWRDALEQAPEELALPLAQPRTGVQDSAAGSLPVALAPSVSDGIRRLASAHTTTPFVTLLGAFGLALGELAGTRELVVGVPAAGRTRAELEDVVGFFVNSLPIRMRFAATNPADGVVGAVRDSVVSAFANQDLPFGEIVRTASPPRAPGRHPLFQTWFVYDDPAAQMNLGGARLERLDFQELTVRFDLALHVRDDGDCFRGAFTYRRSLLDASFVEAVRDQFQAAAELIGTTR